MLMTEVQGWAAIAPPAALSREGEPGSVLTASESRLTDRPMVLVVDDDEDARETVATFLQCHDMSVVKVSTAESALVVAACFPVAAIVLDVLLPDWSGFDVCRALRADSGTKDIPVIMLTSLTEVAEEVSGVLAGASAFLVKPVSREKLLRHLMDLL